MPSEKQIRKQYERILKKLYIDPDKLECCKRQPEKLQCCKRQQIIKKTIVKEEIFIKNIQPPLLLVEFIVKIELGSFIIEL